MNMNINMSMNMNIHVDLDVDVDLDMDMIITSFHKITKVCIGQLVEALSNKKLNC
jgi:hypothetical protein